MEKEAHKLREYFEQSPKGEGESMQTGETRELWVEKMTVLMGEGDGVCLKMKVSEEQLGGHCGQSKVVRMERGES